jgi:Zn-dependent protease with chaperone function
MKATELRIRKEEILFKICLIFSTIIWAALVISVVGILYGLLLGMFFFCAQALMIAYIRGHAVKLSPEQLPHLHAKVVEAASKMEITEIPEAYVMQAGGTLNAFATKFFSRNFIVIFSDLIDACDPEGKEADMIIGHELGHLALGHLRWLVFLMPARLLPWIGAAYSRACEYSCDRCGLEIVDDLDTACRGLTILAVGGKLAPQVNLPAFAAQVQETGGFWTSIYELNASHPFLPKRIAALINWKNPGTVAIPGRKIMAYPLAPALGIGAGGAAAAPLVAVAVIGIMAAIAIPQFHHYREEARQAAALQGMDQVLRDGQNLAVAHSQRNGTWPCTPEDLDDAALISKVASNGWEMEVNCEYNYLALFYPENNQTHYRAVIFETGEIEEGVYEVVSE